MTIALTINGVTFAYPETNDVEWGFEATGWANAVTNGMLQRAGGLFTLLAEVDFGISFGLKSVYYKSRATFPATSGIVRLGNAETICWRNFANTGNLCIAVSAADWLQFNGVDLVDVSSSQTITNKTISGSSIVFAGDPFSAVVTDGAGALDFQTGADDRVLQSTGAASSPAFDRFLQQNLYNNAVSPVGVDGDLWWSPSTDRLQVHNGASFNPIVSNINFQDGTVITSAQANQLFKYNGTNWVNTTHSYQAEGTVQTTDGTLTTAITISIPMDRAMTFIIRGSGFETATGDTHAEVIKGAVKRSGGTSSFVGGSYQEEIFTDSGGSTWAIEVSPDDPTDTLLVTVQGQAAKTIRWVVTIDYTLYTP